MLNRPAPLTHSLTARLTAFVDARLGPKGAAQLAMMLSVVAFVSEHPGDAAMTVKAARNSSS